MEEKKIWKKKHFVNVDRKYQPVRQLSRKNFENGLGPNFSRLEPGHEDLDEHVGYLELCFFVNLVRVQPGSSFAGRFPRTFVRFSGMLYTVRGFLLLVVWLMPQNRFGRFWAPGGGRL